MARQTGYTCDICKKFEASENLPKDWMTLSCPSVEKKEASTFDLCSSRCLAELAVQRANVLEGHSLKLSSVRQKPDPSSISQKDHKAHHVARNKVNPDCPFCQAETQ